MAGQIDNYPGQTKGLSAASDRWVIVTPHDTNPLAELPKFIMIGHDGAAGPAVGNIVMQGPNGVDATFRVAPGAVIDVRPYIIKSTGTTAGLVIIACL